MLARVALVARAARADARLRSRGLQPRMLCLKRGRRTGAIPGKPFFFRAPAAVESLRALGVRAVSLANNHALDYGELALADTIDLLERAGIASAGAGFGLEGARRGVIVDAAGGRVGLLAFTDHPREHRARPAARGVGAGGPSAPASGLADGRAGAAAPRDQGSDRLFALGAQHEHRAGPLAAAARGGAPCCGRRPRRGATPRTSSTGWSVMSAASRLTTSAARSTTTRSTRAAERPGPARSLEPGWRLGARARRSATALRLHGARSGRGRRLDRDEAGPGMRGARARP